MRAIVLALALLAACAPTQQTANPVNPPPPNPPPSALGQGSVGAPTPSDVRVHINAAQNGQTIEVRLNQRFAVELVGVPTAGYLWSPVQMPAFLTRAGEASGATTAAQSQPGFVGGNHWEVFMFVPMEEGAGELVLAQRRPWETNEPPNAVFRVTIVTR